MNSSESIIGLYSRIQRITHSSCYFCDGTIAKKVTPTLQLGDSSLLLSGVESLTHAIHHCMGGSGGRRTGVCSSCLHHLFETRGRTAADPSVSHFFNRVYRFITAEGRAAAEKSNSH